MSFEIPFLLKDDWKLIPVLELIRKGYIAKPMDGNHGGIHPKSNDYVKSGVPFVMASDLLDGRINFETCKFITPEQAYNLKKGFAKRGDVLLTHKATLGRTAIIQSSEYDTIVLTPQVTYYRVLNKQMLNNKYLFYYFNSIFFQNILHAWAGSGSTRAYIGITAQQKLPIILPPYSEQVKIAKVLGDLDKKITLNNQINETLEAMAQALFKSWFIDFEPVKAKIEAKEAGQDAEGILLAAMSAISGKEIEALKTLQNTTPEEYAELKAIAEQFPDSLEESELGLIPKGWEVKSLNKLGEIVCGKTPSKKYEEYYGGNIPFIKIPDMHNEVFITTVSEYLSDEGAKTQRKKEIPANSIIVSCIATVGLVSITTEKSHTNQQINSLIPKEDFYLEYLFFDLRNKKKLLLDLASGGSATLNLNTGNFSKIESLIPTDDLLKAYKSKVKNLFNKILLNKKENQNLIELRDTLLPKLLSGKIDVSNVEIDELPENED